MINLKSFTITVVDNALRLHVTHISPKIIDKSVIYNLYKFNIIKGIRYENGRYILKINLNLGRRISIKNWWRSGSRIRLSWVQLTKLKLNQQLGVYIFATPRGLLSQHEVIKYKTTGYLTYQIFLK